jgi:hypothetical protein
MKLILPVVFLLILSSFIVPGEGPDRVTSGMKNAALLADGPYVIYRGGLVHTKYVKEQDGLPLVHADSVVLAEKSTILLRVNTDIPGKTFPVKLKDQLVDEKTEFPGVEKMFVVSDIEGNFAALRKLLQGNGVIDAEFNWTFGNGHLVLTGDFVDRGDQVTEVLWLIYSLEEKAKQAGGYVHFILGNHEIMNMSGDLRYLNRKYVNNAQLLNENFVMLFGENSELGRWFRTKNVVEKVGGILFVHGGVSDLVNRMNISLPEINSLVRPFYADSTFKYPDPRLDTLYSDWGPFWYRGYYTAGPTPVPPRIDSTLEKFHARHIVTGHSVIADTVSVLFDGRLFNTDVRHANGSSEGLLIMGNKAYRVNALGEKFLLPVRRREE